MQMQLTRYATTYRPEPAQTLLCSPLLSSPGLPVTSHALHLSITRRLKRSPHNLDRIGRQQRHRGNDCSLPPKVHTRDVRQVEVALRICAAAAQERDRPEIDTACAEDAGDHEPVPRRDLHSHHDEFVQDQHGEGDADHAREDEGMVHIDAYEQLAEALDHAALVDADRDPDEEALVAEGTAGLELGVELRVEVCDALVDVAVEDEREDGHHGVNSAVTDEQPVFVECVGLELGGNAVDGLTDGDDEAAVDDELGEFGGPLVRVAAMPDKEFDQVAELLNAEVGGERGLAAFFADDADAYVRGLDHGDVVAAVADATDALFGVGANKAGHVGFLRGGASAGDDGGQLDGDGDEFGAVVVKH